MEHSSDRGSGGLANAYDIFMNVDNPYTPRHVLNGADQMTEVRLTDVHTAEINWQPDPNLSTDENFDNFSKAYDAALAKLQPTETDSTDDDYDWRSTYEYTHDC